MRRNLLRPQVPGTPVVKANLQGVAEVPRDLTPGRLQPSQPPGLLPGQGFPVSLPGFNFAPAGCLPQNLLGDANIAPGAQATLITVQVPALLRYRIAWIGFGADDEAALGFLTWSILVNSSPVSSYSQQTSAVGTIVQPASIIVLADSTAKVDVVATIDPTAALTYRYIARTDGWFYVEENK